MRARFVLFLVAGFFGCHRKPDADQMCERIRQLAAASHADGEFDHAACLSGAQRMAAENPKQLACIDKCSHHLGWGEYQLCAARCTKPKR